MKGRRRCAHWCKEVSGGHFLSPWESPWTAERIRMGVGSRPCGAQKAMVTSAFFCFLSSASSIGLRPVLYPKRPPECAKYTKAQRFFFGLLYHLTWAMPCDKLNISGTLLCCSLQLLWLMDAGKARPEGVLWQNPTGRATELRNETVGKQDTVLRDDSVCVIVIVETQ